MTGEIPWHESCSLKSSLYEEAVRNAISLGGDSDTLACISGGIAQAFYGIPPSIASEVRRRLPSEFLRIIDAFAGRYLDAAW